MPSSNAIVELRTLADINALYVIDQDCTLTKELYERPLRPYRLIRLEASCQYLKKGNAAHNFISVGTSWSAKTDRSC